MQCEKCEKEMVSIQEDFSRSYCAITWYCSGCDSFWKDEVLHRFRKVENEDEIEMEDCRGLLEFYEDR